MPEAHHDGIEVSVEEERYLRRAFRRFALPYLLVLVTGITGAALAFNAALPAPTSDASDELQSIVSEAASLREAIASLREELREQRESSGKRLVALEGGLEQLRAGRGNETPLELADRIDHTHQRVNALEGRLRQLETPRTSAPGASPPAAPVPPLPTRHELPADPTWPPASDELP